MVAIAYIVEQKLCYFSRLSITVYSSYFWIHLKVAGLVHIPPLWWTEYEVDSELFHFGGRAYSDEENIGYFSGKNDVIMSIRTNGEIIKEWDDFPRFLKEEINEAEKMMIQEVPEKVILKTE